MNGWFDESLKMQKQMLDASRASVASGDALVKVQEATKKAAEANLAAYKAWLALWGVGP